MSRSVTQVRLRANDAGQCPRSVVPTVAGSGRARENRMITHHPHQARRRRRHAIVAAGARRGTGEGRHWKLHYRGPTTSMHRANQRARLEARPDRPIGSHRSASPRRTSRAAQEEVYAELIQPTAGRGRDPDVLERAVNVAAGPGRAAARAGRELTPTSPATAAESFDWGLFATLILSAWWLAQRPPRSFSPRPERGTGSDTGGESLPGKAARPEGAALHSEPEVRRAPG